MKLEKLQQEAERLETEIAEASTTYQYARAEKLQKRLAKVNRKLERAKPSAGAARAYASSRVVEPKDSCSRIMGYEILNADGIMRIDANHYSCLLEADDVNYIGARADEQTDVRVMWADYLNAVDHTVKVQPCLLNRRITADDFLGSLAMSPVPGDELGNALRAEYNAYCESRLAQSSRTMRRTRTVCITVEASTMEKAAPALAREAERFIRLMRELESDARVLNGQQRLDAMCAYTHPDDAPGTVSFADLEGSVGLTTRDLVAPTRVLHVDEDRGDARMIVGRRWVKTYVLGVEGYGVTMRDTFITDLSSLPYDIGVTWHIRPWETEAAISSAENHLFNITEENNAYKQRVSKPERGFFIDDDNMPSAMREAQAEAQALRDDLVRNDMRNFSVTTVVTVMGRDEAELAEACKEVESVFSTHRKSIPDAWGALREEAFNAAMPIGSLKLPYVRTLTTAPVAHMLMWASAELMDDGGTLMGVNPTTRNFELYDPTRYEHTNSFTLAMPGGGKSVNAKLTRIIQTRLRHPDDDVIIIDPESEYTPVTAALGGQVVNISETSDDHVNPMDISAYYGSDDPDNMANPVPSKVSFLQTMARMMATHISDAEVNLLDQAARMAYSSWLQAPSAENIPTLQDVYDHLCGVEGQHAEDAHHLALLLNRFVEGTLSVFNHPTNVEISNHLVDFVLADLSAELKPIAMMVVLDHIWVRVSANRKSGRRTWLIVDEFQLLLDDAQTVDKLDRFFTRGRKWDLYNLAITQNISRVLDFEQTRYMLQNSPFLTIMHQSPDGARELGDLLSLSDDQVRFLRSCGRGQGLYVLQNMVVPFDFTIDERTCPKLYSIVTTSPADIKRMMRRVGAGTGALYATPAAEVGDDLDEPDTDSETPEALIDAIPDPSSAWRLLAEREEELRCAPAPAPTAAEPALPHPGTPASPQSGATAAERSETVGETDPEALYVPAPRQAPAHDGSDLHSPGDPRSPEPTGDVDQLLCGMFDGLAGDAPQEPATGPAPGARADRWTQANLEAFDSAVELIRQEEEAYSAESAPIPAPEPAAPQGDIAGKPEDPARATRSAMGRVFGRSGTPDARDGVKPQATAGEHLERMRDPAFRAAYEALAAAHEEGSADPSEFGLYVPAPRRPGTAPFIEPDEASGQGAWIG